LGQAVYIMRKINSYTSVAGFLPKAMTSVFLLALMVSCGGEREAPKGAENVSPRIRKNIVLQSPKANERYAIGDTLRFLFAHRDNKPIDSLWLENDKTKTSVSGAAVNVPSARLGVGVPDLKVTVFADGQNETIYPKVRVLPDQPPVRYTYRVVKTYPHDESSYTQGLFFRGDTLYESTGQRGYSTIRKYNYRDGKPLVNVNLDDQYFGEGATYWNHQIFQLTWMARKAFVYDETLAKRKEYTHTYEGWGLTTKGDTLVLSDGSEKLYLINPVDFSEIGVVQVYDNQGKVTELNELEWVDGVLYANIYGLDKVAIIDLSTGAVTGYIDGSGLIDRSRYVGMDYAMNGIAVHEDGRLFLTGKWWPSLFEVAIYQVGGN